MKKVIIDQIEKIKVETTKYAYYNQISSIFNFVIKQFSLMLILIFMYMTKINIYSIFVVTFYFYSIDGIIELSDYICRAKERLVLRNQFLCE